jgi:glycerol-3-phosphate acyltransferase PlsY
VRSVPSGHLPGDLFIALVALAAFGGHLYPVYLGCKGGVKGVATAAGCFLVIAPLACLVALLVFVMVVCLFNRVSAASMSGALTLPVAVWQTSASAVLTLCAALMAGWIVWRHKANIVRLVQGTEPPAWKTKHSDG